MTRSCPIAAPRASAGGGARLRHVCSLVAVAVALVVTPQTTAAQPADPDWPCVQRKVPSLSPGSMWPGLSEEMLAADWRGDRQVSALVSRVAPRRVTLEEAQQAVQSFAAELGEHKQEKLTLLFVGLFQTLDAERSDVMRGIERFARRQAQMAQRILADRAALEESRQGNDPGPVDLTEPVEELTTAIRVFEDRRQSLTYVCEVPRIIEQRLFSLARAIQAELG